MKKFARSLCLVLGLAFCLTLTGSADDAKKDEPKKEIAPKGQLPQGFGKLGLSDEQKAKVYAVQAKYKSKIAELKKQLDEAQKEEKTAIFDLLTDAQKARFKELALEKAGGGSGNSKPETKDDKKP